MKNNDLTQISVFDGNQVRKVLFNNQWYFSVVDVCSVLTQSSDPRAYWKKLKQRLVADGSQLVTFCHQLKLESADGKKYLTDCATMEGMFRIIQSIPSNE
jgi:prophage antirepressor-like protein